MTDLELFVFLGRVRVDGPQVGDAPRQTEGFLLHEGAILWRRGEQRTLKGDLAILRDDSDSSLDLHLGSRLVHANGSQGF